MKGASVPSSCRRKAPPALTAPPKEPLPPHALRPHRTGATVNGAGTCQRLRRSETEVRGCGLRTRTTCPAAPAPGARGTRLPGPRTPAAHGPLYLKRRLAVVVLQLLVPASKQQHPGAAVLHGGEKTGVSGWHAGHRPSPGGRPEAPAHRRAQGPQAKSEGRASSLRRGWGAGIRVTTWGDRLGPRDATGGSSALNTLNGDLAPRRTRPLLKLISHVTRTRKIHRE